MMSQMREKLLVAFGDTYQQFSVAVEQGEMRSARRALGRLKDLKERLISARVEEAFRYLHVGNGERSCLVSRDEDGRSVVVQAWNGCEECEVTRFRDMESAHDTLTRSGYIAMSMI